MTRELRVLDDEAALARAAAEVFRDAARAAVTARGTFAVALAGGRTPRAAYALLADAAAPYRAAIPWERVQVWFGDERAVPGGDPRSNVRMAREALLARVPIPEANVHAVEGALPPEEAARRYDAALRALASGGAAPRLDLVLLGLGADGHTASLFPGSAALAERERLAVAVEAPAEPPHRITVTLPVLAAAAEIAFLVAGEGKRAALARALAPERDPDPVPAARVRPRDGTVRWLVDRAAAGGALPAR